MWKLSSSSLEILVNIDEGEWQSLNDYDGNKANIVPDRARKYWQAVREGRLKVAHYRPATSLVGVGGNVGIGTGG
ncbi:hypothetical protein ANCCAN_10020 [Ancylostoma caninum]|uniref:Uncharacterized protein n=1 Tax=Ancylostoma caninum TaxID=29170 RepID=A0A368GHZ7_ANCCA|nr:hypothetical protein ANCCAN_10020 [Ancylostoma caninum]